MQKNEVLYTTLDSVKARLIQKVQFQSEPDNLVQGELPDVLLVQLIRDAETEVEQELRARYAIPFRSYRFNTYEGLPDHTRRALRTIVDLKAVLNILETDFGDGGVFDAKAYSSAMRSRYDENLMRLMGQDREAENSPVRRFRKSPPLDDLTLAPTNIADDGIKGAVLGSGNNPYRTPSASEYAGHQVNDPSLVNFWPSRYERGRY